MCQMLDAEIDAAFMARDRVLYDKLSEDKRKWIEFKKKDQTESGNGAVEKSSKEVSVKKKVKVQSGKELTNDLVGLSPYWATAMKELSRYIPLSIFDPTWLRQDLNLTSNKSSRAKTRDADSLSYNGSPVPSEWRTSVAQWHRQKDLFLAYLEFYKHDEVLPTMKKHFENVINIQNENDGCWITAFRYDIEMRQAYLIFRVGEEEEMADIGVRNTTILRRAERATIRRNDDLFLDNPYAHGQSKAYIDPIDGSNWSGRSMAWDDPSRGETKEEKSEISKSSQSVRSALWTQGRSEAHSVANPLVQTRTPVAYHHQPQQPQPTPQAYSSYVQPPTQPANHNIGMNPNFRGNPKNYIHGYRPNFRGGRGNGMEGGVGNGQGSSTGNQGSWGRNRQGDENPGQHQNQGNRGGVGRGFNQKK